MMGRDHALSGALAFAGLAPALHVTDAHLAAGIVLCAGAGVLPDIDHRDTSVSSSFGFLTEGFSWLVAKLSGGHRHGTHSLFGIAVFTAGAFAAGAYQLSGPKVSGIGHPAFSWHLVPAVLFLSLLYSAALRALHVGGHHGDLLGIAAAVVTCYTGADLTRLPVGPVAHPDARGRGRARLRGAHRRRRADARRLPDLLAVQHARVPPAAEAVPVHDGEAVRDLDHLPAAGGRARPRALERHRPPAPAVVTGKDAHGVSDARPRTSGSASPGAVTSRLQILPRRLGGVHLAVVVEPL